MSLLSVCCVLSVNFSNFSKRSHGRSSAGSSSQQFLDCPTHRARLLAGSRQQASRLDLLHSEFLRKNEVGDIFVAVSLSY